MKLVAITMNKLIIWIIAVVVILIGLWLLFGFTKPNQVPGPFTAPAPSQQILSDLEAIDLGDLDKEFQSIDEDLNSL